MQYVKILTILIRLSSTGDSHNICEKNPIYCSILKINKRVDKKFAMEVSNYISRYSKIYKTDPYITVAIMAQETMFRNISTEIDLGVYQLNIDTLQMYGKDPIKVVTDLEYATETHIWLLSKKKTYCKETKYPWACYHSMTPKYYNKYVKAINKYYQIIKEN